MRIFGLIAWFVFGFTASAQAHETLYSSLAKKPANNPFSFSSPAPATLSDARTDETGSQSLCARDSPCADAEAIWPIQPISEDYEGFAQLPTSFLLILPISLFLLFAALPGIGGGQRRRL